MPDVVSVEITPRSSARMYVQESRYEGGTVTRVRSYLVKGNTAVARRYVESEHPDMRWSWEFTRCGGMDGQGNNP